LSFPSTKNFEIANHYYVKRGLISNRQALKALWQGYNFVMVFVLPAWSCFTVYICTLAIFRESNFSLILLFLHCARFFASSNFGRTRQRLGLTRGHTSYLRSGQSCWCARGSLRLPRLQNFSALSNFIETCHSKSGARKVPPPLTSPPPPSCPPIRLLMQSTLTRRERCR
jgi:hypothetical protein